MKITILLLITAILQVSASSFAQKITLNERKVPLVKIFEKIRAQSGIDFMFSESTLKDAKEVSIRVKEMQLKDVLKELFKDQALEYTLNARSVTVSRKNPGMLDKIIQIFNRIDIVGTVKDERNEPLPSATIMVKNNKLFTTTDRNGRFKLSGLDENDAIIISYIGYKTKEFKATADFSNIRLELSDSKLDELQIVGYGKESRRFSVGSSASITADQIEQQPVTNVLSALQGRIPGMNVTSTSGAPGAQVKIQVRGQNTLRSSLNANTPYDQPLFIIDGVPFAPQNENVGSNGYLFGSNIQPSGYSALNGISPQDIESITVLKDADATSIYGSQGANGVILITTKKAKGNKTSFALSAVSGYNFEAQPVDLLNTEQYLQLRREAFQSDGLTPSVNNSSSSAYAPDLLIFDQTKYTNFYKVIRQNTSKFTNLHTSLSGGNENNSFFVSAGLAHSTYNFPGDFSDNKYTLHSNFNHTSDNRRFTIDFTNDYSYNRNYSPSNSISNTAILLPPNLPELVGPSGDLVWNYKGINLDKIQYNGYLRQPSVMNMFNMNTSTVMSYKLGKGFTLKGVFGYNRVSTSEKSSAAKATQAPSSSPTSKATFSNGTFQGFNIEPQLNYEHTVGKGALEVIVGAGYRKNTTDQTTTEGFNYSSDNLLGSINGASEVTSSNSNQLYKYVSGFARVRYIYDQKYLLSLNGRRDGSSNFGPDRQFGNFGSAGLGWIFSNEKLFKAAVPFVSYAKISGNYGTNGSDGIAPYLYQPFWGIVKGTQNFEGVKPLQPLNLYQPNYSWALKKALNVTLDLGFFSDKLLLGVNYYLNKEGNQLITYPLAIQAGINNVVQNLDAKVQNQGWEITLNTKNIDQDKLKWSTDFNISFNRNKLLYYPDLESSSFVNQYMIGKSTNSVQLYKFKGVNQITGLFEYYNAKGEVTSAPNYGAVARDGDFTETVDLAPKFYGGMGNTITYKNFSLYFFFQFSKQTSANYLSYLYGSAIPGNMINQPVAILGNYWQKEGDVKQLQKLTTGLDSDAATAGAAFTMSTGAYSDNTYVRLKTLSLSYSIPEKWLKKVSINGASLYMNAQNFLTITNYKVGDPEQAGNLIAYPIQKTVVLGLSVNLK